MAFLNIRNNFSWFPGELEEIAAEFAENGKPLPRILVYETLSGPVELIPFTLEEIDSVIVKLNALKAEQHNLPAFLKPQAD